MYEDLFKGRGMGGTRTGLGGASVKQIPSPGSRTGLQLHGDASSDSNGAVQPSPGVTLNTPQDFYDRWHSRVNWSRPSVFGHWEKDRMSPVYAANYPGIMTQAHLAHMLSDPYAMPEGALRGALEGQNKLYDVARAKGRSDTLGSGAGGGGVARGLRGNIEGARAANMSSTLRDWEKYKIDKGDQRLKDFGLGWMDRYNQATAIAAGQPPANNQGSDAMDYIQMAMMMYGMFV